MMRDLAEKYYLEDNCNCAEALLHTVNDTCGLGLRQEDFRLVGAFGGGFGCGITCGALAGAMAALGGMVIRDRAHATEGFKGLCAAYVSAFADKLGDVNCEVLKERYFADGGSRCLRTVQLAADVFEAFARENGIGMERGDVSLREGGTGCAVCGSNPAETVESN